MRQSQSQPSQSRTGETGGHSSSSGIGRLFRVLLWRGLLLVFGSGAAAIAGILWAEQMPRTAPEPPLIERWLGTFGGTVAPYSGDRAAQLTQPRVSLSVEQRQQLQGQVQQLQRDLKVLRDRTQALETQLGTPQSEEPLEMRLQSLSSQLQDPPQAIATPVTHLSVPTPAQRWRVTLPSDALFQEGSLFKPDAPLILDKVVADLQSHPGAMIQIAGHTDDAGESIANRDLSFRQARVVQDYLAKTLGSRYHLSAIGFGETRPVVDNSTNTHRQRNRRLEIAIIR